jgi:hypothetical protein
MIQGDVLAHEANYPLKDIIILEGRRKLHDNRSQANDLQVNLDNISPVFRNIRNNTSDNIH